MNNWYEIDPHTGEVVTGEIYFIQPIMCGTALIKIGYTTNVAKRIKDLQSACPVELTLLAHTPGNRCMEHELHKRFSAYHVRGEWFRPNQKLLSLIESVLDGEPNPIAKMRTQYSKEIVTKFPQSDAPESEWIAWRAFKQRKQTT